MRNAYGHGVVGALRTGFEQVEGRAPLLVVMGDLSDDLERVGRMLEVCQQGYDVVVGSRYMPGGAMIGGPGLKKLPSRMAGVSLRYPRGIPTHDATNAFKIYDAAPEITVRAFIHGYRIVQVLSVWRDRTSGESRFRLWSWPPSYLRWYCYAFQPRRSRA